MVSKTNSGVVFSTASVGPAVLAGFGSRSNSASDLTPILVTCLVVEFRRFLWVVVL